MHECDLYKTAPQAGDVGMCVVCYQWWRNNGEDTWGDCRWTAISPAQAAAAAREPMPARAILDTLETAAVRMEIMQ